MDFSDKDLTENNNPSLEIAKLLFGYGVASNSIISNDSEDMADLAMLLMEILLHGISFLTSNHSVLFDLDTTDNPMVENLQHYFRKVSIRIIIFELDFDSDDVFADILELAPENIVEGREYYKFLDYLFDFHEPPVTGLHHVLFRFRSKMGQTFGIKFAIM